MVTGRAVGLVFLTLGLFQGIKPVFALMNEFWPRIGVSPAKNPILGHFTAKGPILSLWGPTGPVY